MRKENIFAHELGARLIAAPPGLDIRDAAAVRVVVQECRPDYVIHLAAVTFVPDSIVDPGITYQINFMGTLNLLMALVDASFTGRMLFASSAEVYGVVPEADLPIRESQVLAPRTPYAVSKAAGELLCLQHALTRGIDVVVVRLFNVIGPGQSSKFAVSSFARQIAELEAVGGGELTVGNLDVTRDFIDATDTVDAFVDVLRSGRHGEIYNVCSGAETNLRDLLNALRSLSSIPVGVRVDQKRVRAAEQRRVLGDHRKLTEHTQWQPKVPLADSLASIISDWRMRSHRGEAPGTTSHA
jgi:GDP-4-dehydro-6-deoxy-D-mannose reductase